MERFIQLNLRNDSEKGAADNSPNPSKEPEPPTLESKRLSKMLKKAAHKASTEYGRGGRGGIFSK